MFYEQVALPNETLEAQYESELYQWLGLLLVGPGYNVTVPKVCGTILQFKKNYWTGIINLCGLHHVHWS